MADKRSTLSRSARVASGSISVRISVATNDALVALEIPREKRPKSSGATKDDKIAFLLRRPDILEILERAESFSGKWYYVEDGFNSTTMQLSVYIGNRHHVAEHDTVQLAIEQAVLLEEEAQKKGRK